ncbi:bifunctional folylpolyglutamate synthase/dihydrofolate synthase [Floricoccus penangensis]|uniref:bifunctional folylpolyglutamate synthase/dihydrofolate synthase n=1 Tax=Floricoccus penangensis TaxID=1859475 RepID=UPI00203A76CE|nr:folylpolyglutamate synthase/dihydrofolate synthase family protein [Floricoccus penangensis]URZ88277.1 bifunctional folylpolyglutamate synthase/dihydrofolate synthase [Floricoccus penangensis]
MIENEIDAVKWIHNRKKYGPKPGLMRVEALLELIGNPHSDLEIIHVAGTNGKGSTVSYLRSLLMEEGLKVATFTSPYIEMFNERIAIDGKFISNSDLTRLVDKLKPSVEEIDKNPKTTGIPEFEFLTVLALEYFKEQDVDVVILEVGLGGLYDSTNIVNPLITAITTIGMDHMDILGNTIEEIAYQKAGIIKKNIPLITGNIEQSALKVIEDKARQLDAPTYCLGQEYKVLKSSSEEEWGETFYFENEEISIVDLNTPLQGLHQIDNAGLAIEIFYLYCQIKKIKFDIKKVRSSLKRTYWPARMEKVMEKPLVVIDGAHNMPAIKSLIENLQSRYADKKIAILFSALESKSIDLMIEKLLNIDNADLIVSSFDFPKSLEISKHDFSNLDLSYKDDWEVVLDELLKNDDYDLILVTGSLYFVSMVRLYFKGNSQSMI